jgi:hypothetical protein
LSTNLNTILFSEFNTPKNPLSPVNAEWISLSLSPVAFLFKPARMEFKSVWCGRNNKKTERFPNVLLRYSSLMLLCSSNHKTEALLTLTSQLSCFIR